MFIVKPSWIIVSCMFKVAVPVCVRRELFLLTWAPKHKLKVPFQNFIVFIKCCLPTLSPPLTDVCNVCNWFTDCKFHYLISTSIHKQPKWNACCYVELKISVWVFISCKLLSCAFTYKLSHLYSIRFNFNMII